MLCVDLVVVSVACVLCESDIGGVVHYSLTLRSTDGHPVDVGACSICKTEKSHNNIKECSQLSSFIKLFSYLQGMAADV